ncbi:MAG: hypothetical protein WB784_01010 [Rhodanobacteraceae bacterium]
MKQRAVGIDLRWMPHCHGLLEVARLVKEIHADVPVVMGGLSSNYFHRGLILYPQPDFVFHGDSTAPPPHDLLTALPDGRSPYGIPNLTRKEKDAAHVNPHTFVPSAPDCVDLRPELVVERVMRHRDCEGLLSFNG